jgi:hypothetical protein
MKKTKCKTCGGKVNSHNYCNACLTFAQPEAQTEHKCSHCNGKGYNTAFQDNVPADGWEARGLPQMAAENVKVPCPKCGGCGQYMIDVKCDCRPQPTEQKECEHKWIMLDEIVQCCKCQIPKPAPQPTDGLLNVW